MMMMVEKTLLNSLVTSRGPLLLPWCLLLVVAHVTVFTKIRALAVFLFKRLPVVASFRFCVLFMFRKWKNSTLFRSNLILGRAKIRDEKWLMRVFEHSKWFSLLSSIERLDATRTDCQCALFKKNVFMCTTCGMISHFFRFKKTKNYKWTMIEHLIALFKNEKDCAKMSVCVVAAMYLIVSWLNLMKIHASEIEAGDDEARFYWRAPVLVSA